MTDRELMLSRLRDVLDFPTPGIVFKDIGPLLADGAAFAAAVDALVAVAEQLGVDAVCGIEARGFLFAAPLAYRLGMGVVPVRKPGKLPGRVHETAYELEYGRNVLQVQVDVFAPGARVIVVDDVLATGGSAAAAGRLVRACGAVVAGYAVLLEIPGLPGRSVLAAADPHAPVHVVLTG